MARSLAKITRADSGGSLARASHAARSRRVRGTIGIAVREVADGGGEAGDGGIKISGRAAVALIPLAQQCPCCLPHPGPDDRRHID